MYFSARLNVDNLCKSKRELCVLHNSTPVKKIPSLFLSLWYTGGLECEVHVPSRAQQEVFRYALWGTRLLYGLFRKLISFFANISSDILTSICISQIGEFRLQLKYIQFIYQKLCVPTAMFFDHFS